jgi:hypothetical protein
MTHMALFSPAYHRAECVSELCLPRKNKDAQTPWKLKSLRSR